MRIWMLWLVRKMSKVQGRRGVKLETNDQLPPRTITCKLAQFCSTTAILDKQKIISESQQLQTGFFVFGAATLFSFLPCRHRISLFRASLSSQPPSGNQVVPHNELSL
jgi:hypothetical protein